MGTFYEPQALFLISLYYERQATNTTVDCCEKSLPTIFIMLMNYRASVISRDLKVVVLPQLNVCSHIAAIANQSVI